MSQPVQFVIAAREHLWVLSRDGHVLAQFSHAEQATHEGVAHARTLAESGEPAQVWLHAKDKVIEIDTDPTITQREERGDPEAEAIEAEGG